MDQKPSDFLLSVIEFFGILIPGALFVLLQGNFLLKSLNWNTAIDLNKPLDWIETTILAYILGHFLFVMSEFIFGLPINRYAKIFLYSKTKIYYEAVRDKVVLPDEVKNKAPDNHADVFYSAFSYIRIHSPDAMSELEHTTSQYKLFRSLTLLFLLDTILTFLFKECSHHHLIFSVTLTLLSFLRFWWLFDWTYRLAFDFFFQLNKKDAY